MATLESEAASVSLRPHGMVLEFARLHPQEFSRVLSGCDASEVRTILGSMSDAQLIPVLAYLKRDISSTFLQDQNSDTLVSWLNQATVDEAVRMIRRLGADSLDEILPRLQDSGKRRALGHLLVVGRNTVGELADKDFMVFASSELVDSVRSAIQATDDRDAIESAIVVNEDESVVGLIDFVLLAQAKSSAPISSCVRRTTLIPASARPQSVVHLADWHRIDRLPVVDQDSVPIGVVRWEQIAEISPSQNETETGDFNIFLELLGSMFDVGKELLDLRQRQPSK